MSNRCRFVENMPVVLVAACIAAASGGHAAPAAAQEGAPPADVRAVIEGTWELVEWHVGDRVLRPPEMEGRWMVHDGLVMATRHRNGPDDFESTAGYGEYRWGPMTWTYGYERSEDLRGPSPEDVELTVTGSNPIRMRTFRISRDGDMLVLDGETLRWEYDVPGRTFLLKTSGGRPIRRYRKVAWPEPRTDTASVLRSPRPDAPGASRLGPR